MKNLLMAVTILCASQSATAYCFKEAASRYHVDESLLIAIAKTESRLDQNAIGRNQNGTEDIGLMGINTSWLPKLRKFGIDRKRLEDPCINANVGAWILAENFIQHGRTWNAVGAYNAKTPAKREIYIQKVWNNLYAKADK